MRFRTAFAALSIVALSAACAEEAEAPPEPVESSPAPSAPSAPPISYACESGQSVTVAYPDTATAQLSYQGVPLYASPDADGLVVPLDRGCLVHDYRPEVELRPRG